MSIPDVCSCRPSRSRHFGGRIDPGRGMTDIVLPFVEARILREDGSDADYDKVGELVLRSPTVTVALGYWNNEKAT
jgi:acyl-CoA synthetase (AMP-forming)/AMP-acid ligase II